MAKPLEVDPAELDLRRFLRRGDGVLWGQGSAEPVALVDRLIEQCEEIGDLSGFSGLTYREVLATPRAEALDLVSYGALGALAKVAARRPLRVVPAHFSALPALFAAGALPGDVAMVQVAPPGADGNCSLGLDATYVADAIYHARLVIAEVNETVPWVPGASLPWERIDVAVRTATPPLELPAARGGLAEARIAARIAALVDDGDTIQVGVGALPEAILRELRGARDLGVHSGMICDPIADLVESGAITGSRKDADRGLVVTGAALGSNRLFDFLRATESVVLRPVSYTHRPDVLARVGRLVAVNGALEVDLSGQVNAESAGGRYVGAVGGQVDFLRGAAAAGGLAIVALPATVARTGASRIVTALNGPVTTSRVDVDLVVTEFGVARLRGLDLAERARALTAIAAPEHREALDRASAVGTLRA
jgi:acyl-CoA hydrolase